MTNAIATNAGLPNAVAVAARWGGAGLTFNTATVAVLAGILIIGIGIGIPYQQHIGLPGQHRQQRTARSGCA